MKPFEYSKDRHSRTQSPGQLSTYQKYKPVLRIEFTRKCVYCRMPDGLRGAEGFGVDHYRPKKYFPELLKHYDNLYYCCNPCNRRKTSFWPSDPQSAQFIPNPCEHIMFAHLQFKDELIIAKSEAGKFTLEFLDLNDPALVSQRRAMQSLIGICQDQITKYGTVIAALDKMRKQQTDPDAELLESIQALNTKLLELRFDLEMMSGDPDG